MKLSDIDKTLNEAPVNMLKRAGTKLAKHTPFAPDVRRRAKGRDVLQKAANDLNAAWQEYLGFAGIDHNAVTPEQILGFLKQEGYLATGQKVVQAAVDKRSKGSDSEDEKIEPTLGPAEKEEQSEEEIRKAYADYFADLKSESFEARLANILTEDDEQQVTFSNDEVQQLLLSTIKAVHQSKPEALASKVNSKAQSSSGEKDADPSDVLTQEELQAYGAFFDDFAANVIQKVQNSSMQDREKKKLIKAIWIDFKKAAKDVGFNIG